MFSLGRTLSAMLRLMPLFCSNERSELLYHLAATTVPPTTTPLSLKDSYDFGGPVDTEGGKLSISVMFSRPAARAASRSSLSASKARPSKQDHQVSMGGGYKKMPFTLYFSLPEMLL